MITKKTFVNEIQDGETVQTVFLVTNKELRPKKANGHYLRLVLADRTGEIIANKWDNYEKPFETVQIDDYAEVKGFAKMWQNKIQLTVNTVNRVNPTEIDVRDFVKTSERPPDEMWNEIKTAIDGFRNPFLKRLLENIFEDEDVRDRFVAAPAAKALHHSFHSGLIEHTLSLLGLVRMVAEHYKGLPINRDLLMTGAILHDIGKIYELSYDKSFNYTDEGRLIGHITIAAMRVKQEIDKIDGFPGELAMQLLHMLLSHHGYYEYGSPKRPKTLEALILYYLDDLDAKVESMYKFISENAGVGKWAGYDSKHFERFIYKGTLIDENKNDTDD